VRDSVTCDVGLPLSDAVSLMTGHMHRSVVTNHGRPVGVISMTDVIRKLIQE
jgi:crotonyl-CoA carboxylase/reductase